MHTTLTRQSRRQVGSATGAGGPPPVPSALVTAPTKIFIARLAALPVFNPDGDQLGRVRDVVVSLNAGPTPPRVLGLVLEIQQRKRIFVPMSRVNAIDAAQVVLSTGTLNLRRFEKRAGETLVLGELLDRKVTSLVTNEVVTVIDAAMEQTRTRDWQLTRVAVKPAAAKFRRRGPVTQHDWNEVTGFSLPEANQDATNLLAVFDKLRPADLAHVMHDLSAKRRNEVAAALDDERLADVIEELPEEDQIAIMSALENERAADVLEAMAPDDAADLLADLPAADAARLLELMEPEEAAPVRRLLHYSENTAGGMMTSEPVVLDPNATVAEALALIRNPDLTPALASQVYVCRPPMVTPTGKYIGTAHMQRLLREPPSALVSGVVDTDIAPLEPDCPLPSVTAHLATYNLVAVPIVDTDGRLLGAVTVDDVLDHLLPANWRETVAHG